MCLALWGWYTPQPRGAARHASGTHRVFCWAFLGQAGRPRVQLVFVHYGCQCPRYLQFNYSFLARQACKTPCGRVALSPGAARHANRACRARKGGPTPAGERHPSHERWRKWRASRAGRLRPERPAGPQLTGWTTTGLLSQAQPSREESISFLSPARAAGAPTFCDATESRQRTQPRGLRPLG